ncbi:MAG: helix-turn-helix domain-containing protein [Chitinophagaceae bacterium]
MIGFFNILLLLGALQGFIISTLLFFRKKHRNTNRILATLIFLIALATFKTYLNTTNWFSYIPYAGLIDVLIPFYIIMPAGPLIFFYIRSCCDSTFIITRKQRIHFLPVLLDLVPLMIAIVYLVGVFTRTIAVDSPRWGGYIDNWNTWVDVPRWLSVTIYSVLALRYLKQQQNNIPAPQLLWLKIFLRVFLVFQAVWFVFLVPYEIPSLTYKLLDLVDWYPLYLPMVVMIYWLGIGGYIMSYQQIQAEKKANGPASVLSAAVIQTTSDALQKAMEQDQLYLNPELDLSVLSQHTGIAPKTISAVLNQHLHKSFNEFVNGYRVQESRKRLLQPNSKQLTIAAIAYESGFNSLATFQRAFKTITGTSPSEFLAQNRVTD